jgi:hypothetical protein
MDPQSILHSERKNLSRDALHKTLRKSFANVEDKRCKGKVLHTLSDALMAGFAMFTLKLPSLLQLDQMRFIPGRENNLKKLFNLVTVPSDTSMREILDEVDPNQLRSAFTDVFRELQRGKVLGAYRFIDNKYLVAVDGTGFFSSDEVNCDNCLEKHSSKTGITTYYHQMLSAVLVHPEIKQVIPLCPEPIVKQDGQTKNDCERNAAERLINWLKKEHDQLPMIIVEDSLASNAPHIRSLMKAGLSFILGAKPGDHKHLFEEVALAGDRLRRIELEREDKTYTIEYMNGVGINASNSDVLVNFIHLEETQRNGKTLKFSWVTDIEVNDDNAFNICQGGRARWKIENETFNTLKNQGYGFEHNYGHGKKNLSTVLAYLMMLAFLVDQTQLLTSKLTQVALAASRRLSEMFRQLRSLFDHFNFDSWIDVYSAIAFGYQAQLFLNVTKKNTS